MSVPGVGAVVSLICRSAVDDPARFTSSKKVGPWVGLTPSRNQSGERDISGGMTKGGDVALRRPLCQAATVTMYEEGWKTVQWTVFPTNGGRSTWLRTWAATEAFIRVDLRKRRPIRRADQLFKGQYRRQAALSHCAKMLDRDDPVTKVLTQIPALFSGP
jgi:hypothetical protein